MLQSQNFRMTKQRQYILDVLRATKSHPTAEEICQAVRQRLPRISLGTVYRNLEILSSCGLIQKLELAGSQRRYDGTTENHYHVRCITCGRVDDLPMSTFDLNMDELEAMTDYEFLSHRVEFFGRCGECKTRLEVAERAAQTPVFEPQAD